MAGNLVTPNQYPTPASTGISDTLDDHVFSTSFGGLVSSPMAGSTSDNKPIDVINGSHVGVKASSTLDTYYYRLWIIPSTVNLGRILGEQSIPIEVWNSFFEERDFGPIEVTGDDTGLTLVGDDSGSFVRLESKMYELQVAAVGAQRYDVQYDWQFEEGGDTFSFLQVLGQRLIAFGLRHNWASPVLEQLSFRTDILTGISGREQRIKLRQTPRRRIEMSYLTLDAEEKAYLEQALMGQSVVYAVPLWHDKSSLQAAASEGSTVFLCDTTLRDYEVGSMVFLLSSDTYEALTVESFSEEGVVTQEPSIYAYPAGAKVCPARFGVMEDKLSLKRHTTHHESVVIPWLINPDNERPNQLESYTPDTYDGLDIYDEQNDYSEAQDIEQTTVREMLDNEIGLLSAAVLEEFPKRDYPFSKLIERSEFGVFLQWFYNRSGKYEPFWWLDYTPAFHLREGIAFDSILLTVKANDYSLLAFQNPMRQDIAINTSAGWVYRHIDDAVNNGDGTATLTLDTAPGVDITVEEDPLICFLRKVRLDSDTLEIIYETNEVIRTATRFKDVI